jgi:hypothetical protein
MQIEMPKIELYRIRSFSDKLTDVFNFLRENWRPMLKYFMYMMLPISIILALPFNHFFEGYFKLITTIDKGNFFSNSEGWLYGISFVASILGFILAALLLESFVYAMIRVYDRRPQRLKDLCYEDFRDDLFFCLKRGVIMALTGLAIMIVVAIICAILAALAFVVSFQFGTAMTVVGIILLYIALIVFGLPMYMVAPVYMLEDEIGVIGAYKKGLRLGFATWGGVFAVMFIIGILASILQTFTMMPWYLLSMVKMIFTLTNDMDKPFFHSFVYSFVQYLTCILMCLGYMLSMVFSLVGIAIQYGHASEKIDGAGVSKRIDKFDEFDNF